MLLLLVATAWAQNGRYDNIAIGPKGVIPFATVGICTQPANTVAAPCTPLASLCASLTDATCTAPNPVVADELGNFHFYVAANQAYTIQVYGPRVAAPYVMRDIQVVNGINGHLIGTTTVDNLIDLGLSASVPVCTDSSKQLSPVCTGLITNADLVNSSVTYNGQAVALGSAGNVNTGAAAHSMTLNQGNGAAETGVLLAAHAVPVGTAASDPTSKVVPDCTDTIGNHLNFTQSTDAWSCGTSVPSGVNVAIQSNVIKTLSGNVSVSATTVTTVMTQAVTMPSSGCPCRAFVSYGFAANTTHALSADSWVFDGTDSFATGGNNTTGSVGSGATFKFSGASYSTGTYANSAAITFTLRIESEDTLTIQAANEFSPQNGWLNIAIVTSN
jgi:hypothetical protein